MYSGRPGSPPRGSLIPSTSTSALTWTGASCCRSSSASCPAVRTYVVVVSFLIEGPEVNEVASDFQNGGFGPPGFFDRESHKQVRSRYGQTEYAAICSASTHLDRWTRQRQPPREVHSCSHKMWPVFHQDARGPHTARCERVLKVGADLDAPRRGSGTLSRNHFQERTASVT